MIQAKHRNRLPLPQPAVVHVRRSYAESRFGQIHLWTAYPSGGGFDERTPVVCLHHSGGSGRLFAPMLRELGHDRSVYAPDLPGHGIVGRRTAQDVGRRPRRARSAISSTACACAQVDLFGYQLGALIAAELAIARPQQIRRVMLWGVPCHSAQDRACLLQDCGDAGNARGRQRCRRRMAACARAPRAERPPATLADEFGDRLRAGANGTRALAATIDYPTARTPAAGEAADAGAAPEG